MQIGLTLGQIIERRKYLGGSDISVISGMNGFQDGYQLWEFKKGKYTPTEENISNRFTLAGNVFEDLILYLFKKRVAEEYSQEIKYTGIREVLHPEYDFLQSHPDEILTNGDVIDCKTGNSRNFIKKWGTEDNPIMPKEYQYQLFYNAGVYYRATGIKPSKLWIPVLQMSNNDYDIAEILAAKGQVASITNLVEYYLTDNEYAKVKQQAMNKYNKEAAKLPDDKKDKVDYQEILGEYAERKVYLKLKKKFQIRVINFDLNTYEAIEKNAVDWWNRYILGDEIPKITYKSVNYLKTKHKYATEGKELQLGEDLDKAVAEFRAAQHKGFSLKYQYENTEEYKEWEKHQQVIGYKEILLLHKIQDAEEAFGNKVHVISTNNPLNSINYERLKREKPDIYNQLVEDGILKIEISDRRIITKDIFQ